MEDLGPPVIRTSTTFQSEYGILHSLIQMMNGPRTIWHAAPRHWAQDTIFILPTTINSTIGAFARTGRIQPNTHPQLPDAQPGLHSYQGDLLDQIIRGNVIGTSTAVYDYLRFPKNRFKVEFTNAGEDYLF